MKTIQVGQRVFSKLYGGRDGVVIAIDGPQTPGTVGTIGGVLSYGGSAKFDVMFESSISRGVPESIVRGVQWIITDEVYSADEVARMKEECQQKINQRQADENARMKARAEERKRHAESNPHLTKVADKPEWSEERTAAANMRVELKRAFPKTKFKVTSDRGAIRVLWTDGPTSEQVKAVTRKFEKGSFDGSTDSYTYDHDATFADVFGGARYVFESRQDTIESVRAAWTEKYPGGLTFGLHNVTVKEVPANWNEIGTEDAIYRAIRETWAEKSFA